MTLVLSSVVSWWRRLFPPTPSWADVAIERGQEALNADPEYRHIRDAHQWGGAVSLWISDKELLRIHADLHRVGSVHVEPVGGGSGGMSTSSAGSAGTHREEGK